MSTYREPVRPGIHQVDDGYLVRLGYWPPLNEALKMIGGRWRATERGWWVSDEDSHGLSEILEPYGLASADDLLAAEATIEEWRRERNRPPFSALLRAVPAGLRRPTYRALAQVLHPDHGGDTATMQALNRARDEVEGRP